MQTLNKLLKLRHIFITGYALNEAKGMVINMMILAISFIIGIVAGTLDILPMIFQKMNKRAIVSAFLQYLFAAVIIVNIDIPGVVWWLEGGLIALALSTPILVIVSEKEAKAIPVISGMSVILGTLIGIAGHFVK